MAEEKKEEQAQEKEQEKEQEQTPAEESAAPAEEAEQVQAEEKEEQQTEEEKAPADAEPAEEEKDDKPAAPIKKKVNKMTLAEVNAKLKDVAENQGGLESRYAAALLDRKSLLESKK